MIITDYKLDTKDNELQTLWKLGELKDKELLEASWQEIADFMNLHYRLDETEYRTESAYRKTYKNGKLFSEQVFQINGGSDIEGLTEMREERVALQKERQRLRDERAQYGKYVRDESRFEQRLDEMEALIMEHGKKKYDFHVTELPITFDSKKEMLVLLSDWHIGLEFKNEFGCFNLNEAKARLDELLVAIREKKELHDCDVCNVAVMGDMISGIIKPGILVANRESAMQQVMLAAEMLSKFLGILCSCFGEVNFVSIAGNHSRMEASKDKAIKDDRLDDVIAWYVKASLKHLPNFKPRDEVDNTVAELGICGKLYYFAHGDHDEITQAGISKLAFMLGEIPYAVCVGHKHYPMMTEVNGVKVVQNGCLPGSGDDHTIEMRLSGKASQTILICDEDGVDAYYPVRLEV